MFEFWKLAPYIYELLSTLHRRKQAVWEKNEWADFTHFSAFLILSDVPGSLDTEQYLLDQRMNECMPMCCLSNF